MRLNQSFELKSLIDGLAQLLLWQTNGAEFFFVYTSYMSDKLFHW